MFRFFLSLYLIGFITDFCVGISIKQSDGVNYRLNTDIEPIDYIIDVTPHFESFTFDGVCTITLKTSKTNVNTITLHKLELNIIEQKLTKKPSLVAPFSLAIENITISSSDYDQTTHKYTLKLASPLVNDELYQLYFKYTGTTKPTSFGFYQDSYEEGNVEKWFVTTRFQPLAARKMYPCFDEPRFKATFSVIVNRPAHFKPSLSNTPMISSHRTSSNLVREYFDKTPKMSTYLVAVLISEFQCRENAMKNFSVCAEPFKYNQTKYTFDVGQKMLQTFDELFDYKYNTHIAKLTMAAVSSYNGMENWGLIIGEPLLFDSKSGTFATRKSVANLIAHEQAHLWFGDIVTCDWWSDLWLNEGFATYFEYFGLAMIESNWGLDTEFLLSKVHVALEGDTLDGSKPLSRKADTMRDIGGMFSQHTYVKGSTIIRMFNYTLGHDKFVAGLRNYLKQNALKTAVPQTLFAAFQTVNDDFNVSEILDGWITQTGYPVISVQISSDRKQIEVRQNRYLRIYDTIHQDKTQWNVPLNWASNIENTDFSYSKPMTILKNSSLKINLKEPIDWIVFNVQQSGFYRVNYDDNTWSSIAKILHKSHATIHVVNRAELINDAFELARYSYTNYKNAINLVHYLQNEIEYAPWAVAFKYFERLLPRFKPNDLFIFEKFGLKLSTRVYKHLGFHQKANHNILDQYNRRNVVEYACKFGVEQCTADARREYDLYRKGNYTIPVDLAPSVLCSVVEHGSEADWDSVWNIITTDGLGDQTWKSVKALGCTKQPNIIKKYLNLILAQKIRYSTEAFESTYTHRQHIHLILDFIYANHKEISSKISSIDSILTKLLRVLSTSEEISRIERFMKENGLDSERLLKDLEEAKSELRWANKYVPVIMDAMEQKL